MGITILTWPQQRLFYNAMGPQAVGGGCRARWRWWLHNIVNLPNVAELFTLEWLILCYVTFTSIKGKYICNQDRSSLTASNITSLLEDVRKAFFKMIVVRISAIYNSVFTERRIVSIGKDAWLK